MVNGQDRLGQANGLHKSGQADGRDGLGMANNQNGLGRRSTQLYWADNPIVPAQPHDLDGHVVGD